MSNIKTVVESSTILLYHWHSGYNFNKFQGCKKVYSSILDIKDMRSKMQTQIEEKMKWNGLEDWNHEKRKSGWEHIIVTSFGMSHCTTLKGCACLNVFHFKLLKEFCNIFAYFKYI